MWEVKIIKKFLTFLLICLSILYPGEFSASAKSESLSWYCIRTKDHKQPSCDAKMSFIKEYGGYYVDESHGDSDKDKVIYLTFDAGYENGNIEKILDVLEQEKVTAAFFVLEHLITKNPDLILRMVENGHLVCNHTSKHLDITKCDTVNQLKAELSQLESKYKSLTGQEMPKFFRPPEGRFSLQSMKFLNQLGYKTIFWSFAYADWDNNNQMPREAALKKILSNIHNGEIMLLHPTSSTNAEIIGDLICNLRSKGYRFGTLYQLVNDNVN